MDKTKVK